MELRLSEGNLKEIDNIRDRIENNSSQLENIVNDIINPYCKDLDKYVRFIADCLHDGENPPTDAELEDFCMNLSTYIYFAGGMCEQLGIKDDIGKAIYKEIYNTARANQDSGTVADKNTEAEIQSLNEALNQVIYQRSYKMIKSKVEMGQEMINSLKRVFDARMNDLELSRGVRKWI